MQVWYGIYASPFGECLIAWTTRGICNLHFLDGNKDTAENLLRCEWSSADIMQDRQAAGVIGDRIFNSIVTKDKPLVVCVKGTNFQIQVWRALLSIPFAGIATYQSLAATIGRPTAARAIGNALGNNPVGYLIPCHRAIRESGEMSGFRWGLERKTAMLGWEASRNRS